VSVCTACYLAQRRAAVVAAARLQLDRQPIDCALCLRPTLAGLDAELGDEVQVLADALYAIANAASSADKGAQALAAAAVMFEQSRRDNGG